MLQQDDSCAYVQSNCTQESVLQYLEFHYCTMAQIEWLSFIVLVRALRACSAGVATH